MIVLILSFCSVFSATSAAEARANHVTEARANKSESSQYASFKRVVSFDELMRLSPKKRDAYIRGLRSLFKDLEQKRVRGASAQVLEQHKFVSALLRIYESSLTSAHAAAPVASGSVQWNGVAKTCEGSYHLYRIFKGQSTTRPSSHVCVSQKKAQKEKCRGNLIPIEQNQEGEFHCATPESFAKLSVGDQKTARSTAYIPMFFFGDSTSLKTYFEKTGPSLDSIVALDLKRTQMAEAARLRNAQQAARLQQRAVVAKAEPKSKPVELPKAKPALAKVEAARPIAVAAPRAQALSARASDGAPVQVRRSKAVAVRSAGRVKPQQAASNQTLRAGKPMRLVPDGSVEPESDETGEALEITSEDKPEAPTLEQCDANAAKACDVDAIEDARAKYSSDSNPDCIYAGSVVGYERGVKQSFRCEPPRSFCFGSSNCKSDSGEAMTPAYTCGPKAVLCNPLLFGVKSDGKTPFCISRDANATLSCEAAVSEESNVVQPLDETHAGIREAWNNFADRLNQLCQGNEISKVLHCEECQVIRARLFSLNVAARGVNSCGAALKFEDSQCQSDGSCAGRPGAHPQPKSNGSSGSLSQSLPNDVRERKPASKEILEN